MNKIILPAIFTLLVSVSYTQEIQTLKTARLGIFKNGTCFVKREGNVNVQEKSFYIKAPEKVLLGTYWVMVGKETSLHSVIVKTDTFKIQRAAKQLGDFLEANIGQDITLYGNATNENLRKLSGKLLDYNKKTALITIATAAGKIVVTSSSTFTWFESSFNPKNTVSSDSIIPIAKVKLNRHVENVSASTISLETGVSWYPSYLFTVINEKEAKLEMKATIVNGETEYLNMPVDIIIGSPEKFFGEAIDPACIVYLGQSLLENRYDNNGLLNNYVLIGNSGTSWQNENRAQSRSGISTGEENTEQLKEGLKNEDLYYYQLGVLDLEKDSRVIVPVMTNNVTYSEIYTADLPVNSPSMKGDNSIQTYHSYVITNNTNAPLTAGSAFVLNKDGQPMSQTRLLYTPVKGISEIKLSKAVDVQVKNEEEIKNRERTTTIRIGSNYYEKITTAGKIIITNYKEKKIKIRVVKDLNGNFETADNNGKNRKTEGGTDIFWEIEIEAGAKAVLNYRYYNLE